MDGRAGDRWTVKPSSVQPGYTLVGALWVRLGERGQYLQASWLVISSHLSCMLFFFLVSLGGKSSTMALSYVYRNPIDNVSNLASVGEFACSLLGEPVTCWRWRVALSGLKSSSVLWIRRHLTRIGDLTAASPVVPGHDQLVTK